MYTKGSTGGGTGTYDSTEERVQRRWVNTVNLPRCHRHSTRTQNKTEQSRQAAQKTLGLRPVLRPFPSFHQNQGRRSRRPNSLRSRFRTRMSKIGRPAPGTWTGRRMGKAEEWDATAQAAARTLEDLKARARPQQRYIKSNTAGSRFSTVRYCTILHTIRK